MTDFDEGPDDPQHTEPLAAASGQTPKAGLGRVPRVAAGLAVAAIATGAYVVGQRTSSSAPTATTTTTIENRPSEASDAMVEFDDPESGISLSYPESWEPLELDGSDPTAVLILSAGGQDSALVRTVGLAEAVTAENLSDLNAVTDGIIADSQVTVLQETEIELNGMPGYYYLYLFTDAETGEEGVHAHYFMFRDRVMNILVFQAVPSDRFDLLAPVFDAVAASFRSAPPTEAPEQP